MTHKGAEPVTNPQASNAIRPSEFDQPEGEEEAGASMPMPEEVERQEQMADSMEALQAPMVPMQADSMLVEEIEQPGQSPLDD
jgi:hypothetical protein